MARIRTIKPEFWKHEDLSALPEATHMLAGALLNHSDDEGYFRANPGLVKAECCPLREPSVSVQDSLKQLAQIGYLKLGVGQDGKRYGRIVTFDEHQRVNRPTPSKIKDLNVVWEDSMIAHAQFTEPSPPERKGKEQGKEGNGVMAPPAKPALPAEPALILMPLNDGSEYPVTESQAAEFSTLYPSVDVRQELRAMRAWAIANPSKRKTKGGVMRFVNSWLAKEQDKGGKSNGGRVSELPLPRLQA